MHTANREQTPRGFGASARVEPTVSAYNFGGDADPPWPGPPTPLFASPDGDPYGEVRAPGGRTWRVKTGTIWVVAAFVILYGGAVAVHRFDGGSPLSRSGASKAVEGAIGPNGSNDATLAALPGVRAPLNGNGHADASSLNEESPNDGFVNGVRRNAAPAVQTAPAVPATPAIAANPAAPAAPATRQSDVSAPPNSATASLAPPASTMQSHRTRDQRSETQSGRAAVYQALATARTQMSKSDLRGARVSLGRALAAEPHNGEALGLLEELRSHEQERDALLNAARACVEQARWNCVWNNAGNALAADASSAEARSLVNRAIVESGAATAPAGPGPDNVEVPMVQ